MNREREPAARSIDSRRSMPLSLFKSLGTIPGISWVSLQMGPPADQIRANPAGMTILDGTADIYDFSDTAALIANLDLVITVDTSVAHLAAALGKPTWVLCRNDSCWRWLMDRDDTPWYPTVQLFTQRSRHNWTEVVDRVYNELTQLAAQHRLREAA